VSGNGNEELRRELDELRGSISRRAQFVAILAHDVRTPLASIVGSANIVFLPIGNRLKGMSEVEVNYRQMILEGVLALQAGDNPSMLAERLDTYLDPAERGAAKNAPAAAAADEAALKEAA
jgi:flagellar motor component MotA